jgi:hypothetical protein
MKRLLRASVIALSLVISATTAYAELVGAVAKTPRRKV